MRCLFSVDLATGLLGALGSAAPKPTPPTSSTCSPVAWSAYCSALTTAHLSRWRKQSPGYCGGSGETGLRLPTVSVFRDRRQPQTPISLVSPVKIEAEDDQHNPCRQTDIAQNQSGDGEATATFPGPIDLTQPDVPEDDSQRGDGQPMISATTAMGWCRLTPAAIQQRGPRLQVGVRVYPTIG